MAQDVSGQRGLRWFVVGALIAISGQLAPCQSCSTSMGPSATQPFMAAPSEKMPAYEVTTIKPAEPNGFRPPLRVYIQRAFGIPPNIVGRVIGPDWINSTNYAIQGKPPDSIRDAMQTMTNADRMKEDDLMMQSLLADRFQLKAHFETREMSVYELVLAKGGSKLTEDSDATKRRVAVGGSMIRATAAPIHTLTDVLECAPDVGGREVIDKTGLSGSYDILLKWTPLKTAAAPGGGSGSPPSPDVEGVSLFTAIEEQLGLKLVPTRGAAVVLVIDHIEKPSEN
jgi:bla regulator protein BlaR1